MVPIHFSFLKKVRVSSTSFHSLARPQGRFSRSVQATLLALAIGVSPVVPSALADPAQNQTQDPQQVPNPDDAKAFNRYIDELLAKPIPQDVDGLLAHMKQVSHVTGAANEKVQQNQLDLDKARAELDGVQKDVEKTKRESDIALQNLQNSEESVKDVSQSMYRGASVDPLTVLSSASGPQAAMERGSYLASLAESKDRTISVLDEDLLKAVNLNSEANRAKFRADFRVNDLGARQRVLDRQTQKLDELKKRVMDVVDGLSPEDRQRWVDSNGPIDVNVEEFLGKLKQPDSPVAAKVNQTGAVAAALSKLGSPYGWGATGPNEFDCSGLMLWAYQQTGKTIPRTSQAQLAGGQPVSRNELQPGDIVGYYPGTTHVGMYIGDGQLVHASDYGIPVQVVPVDSMPISGAVRY